MASQQTALKTYLAADISLSATLTGGIFNAADLGKNGLTPEYAQKNNLLSASLQIKPLAVIVWRNSIATELTIDEPSETRFVELWFYCGVASGAWATIETAKRQAKDRLHRAQLSADNYGANFLTWVDDLGEFTAEELFDTPADRSRYSIQYTRR